MRTLLRLIYPAAALRRVSTSVVQRAKRIEEIVDGNTVTIQAIPVNEAESSRLKIDDPHKACPLCRLNLEVKYDDVLILKQFMRTDGTVLPAEITGLCSRQQLIVERCVMQAHWSGLFAPQIAFDGLGGLDDDPSDGYKQFNRYWDSHIDMWTRNLETRDGSWFYISRYQKPPKNYLQKESKK